MRPQWTVAYKQPNCSPHGRSKYKGTYTSPIRNQHSETQSYLITRANQPTSLTWPKPIMHRVSTPKEYVGTRNQDATPGQLKEPPF